MKNKPKNTFILMIGLEIFSMVITGVIDILFNVPLSMYVVMSVIVIISCLIDLVVVSPIIKVSKKEKQ